MFYKHYFCDYVENIQKEDSIRNYYNFPSKFIIANLFRINRNFNLNR